MTDDCAYPRIGLVRRLLPLHHCGSASANSFHDEANLRRKNLAERHLAGDRKMRLVVLQGRLVHLLEHRLEHHQFDWMRASKRTDIVDCVSICSAR